jgi:SAM-dependent methyltransferase
MSAERVIWHDVECGGYVEDLELWRELARAAGGPILDVGAGTGRIALDLAQHGFEVVALDAEAELLAALSERASAAGVEIETVCADARTFDLDGRRFGAILVPMQTIQLLGGPNGRGAFLRRAVAHLDTDGLLAAALADALEGYDAQRDVPPDPDEGEIDGVQYVSRPMAVVRETAGVAIHRWREVIPPDGAKRVSLDVIRLEDLTPAELEREAAPLGLRAEAPRRIPATDVYVGSTVVMLRK